MPTGIYMLFFRNIIYFFEGNSPLLFELFYVSGNHTEKKCMVYTEHVRNQKKKKFKNIFLIGFQQVLKN